MCAVRKKSPAPCLLLLLWPCLALAQDRDGDRVPDTVAQKVGVPAAAAQELVVIATSPAQRAAGRGDQQPQAPDILALEGCHVGQQRALLRIQFAQKPDFAAAGLIVYLDLDNDPDTGRVDRYHGGVDLMLLVSKNELNRSFHGERFTASNTLTSAALQDDTLWISVDAPWVVQQDRLVFGVHLLAQIQGGSSDTTRHTIARLPRHDAAVPALPARRNNSLRSLADYRYYNDRVKYEELSDKGMTYQQVAPAQPLVPPRPRPALPYAAPRQAGRAGSLERHRVPVQLLEQQQVLRRATPITFGFPLPRGGLFDTAHLRVVSDGGEVVPAQFTVTAFWPDDSLKWVLVDLQTDLDAGQQKQLSVECGQQVRTPAPASPLRVTETDTMIQIDTGAIRVEVDKQRFDLLHRVSLGGRDVVRSSGTGVILRDEQDHQYTQAAAAPRSVLVEQQGPEKVVLRIEGDYADQSGRTYMSYITRIVLHARSARATIAHTHVNTYLDTEFTDINSLVLPLSATGFASVELPVELPAPRATGSASAESPAGSAGITSPFSVTQWDDQQYRVGGSADATYQGCFSGGVGLRSDGGNLNLVVHEFWQRWPKGLAVDGDSATIALLPAQPSAEFGRDLPFWLMFPFVEGKYRFKWGMAFTTCVTVDFAATTSLDQLQADADCPVVAVLPADWYGSTEALGPLSVPATGPLAIWDTYVAGATAPHGPEAEGARVWLLQLRRLVRRTESKLGEQRVRSGARFLPAVRPHRPA